MSQIRCSRIVAHLSGTLSYVWRNWLAAGLLGAFLSFHSQASVITFDDVPVGTGIPPGSGIDVSVSPCFGVNAASVAPGCPATFLDDGGFRFTVLQTAFSDHGHLISSPFGVPGQSFPNNGTQYIGEDTSNLLMTRIGGGTFSLLGFDAAEGFLVLGALIAERARKLRVDGSLSGGGTVSVTFDFDGINDGSGMSADFQNFLLPGSFNNLTAVTWTGLDANGDPGIFVFSIDNVNVTPEPTGAALLGLGFLVLIFLRRRSAEQFFVTKIKVERPLYSRLAFVCETHKAAHAARCTSRAKPA